MLSKADALSILADLGACEEDLKILKKDTRELEEIFNDPRARNKNGDILLRRDVCGQNCWAPQSCYIYDISWINEGPFGNARKRWLDYTYEETLDILTEEHKLWLTNRQEWERRSGIENDE